MSGSGAPHEGARRHLFVSPDFPPHLGGMARRYGELVARYPEPMAVSTVAAEGDAAFDASVEYEIVRQPFAFARSRVIYNQVRWAGSVAAQLRAAGGPYTLHCGAIRAAGYATWLAHRRARSPYLVYVNGQDLLSETRKAGNAFKRIGGTAIFGGASGVVANSAWTADLAREVMAALRVKRPPPVAAIDLGTDPAQFSPSRDSGALRARLSLGSGPLLLTVARVVRHKGQDVAVRALARLRPRYPDLRYLIVGTGYDEPRLRELAASLGVADAVTFAGALSDEDVAEAYATASVYVGLSRVDGPTSVEGFGISFVEAGASGTPSVAGRSGGVPSAVRDGETGFLVDPMSDEAAAAALDRLLGDDALRHSFGEAARRAVETHYNWDRVARETAEFARDVVRLRTRSSAPS